MELLEFFKTILTIVFLCSAKTCHGHYELSHGFFLSEGVLERNEASSYCQKSRAEPANFTVYGAEIIKVLKESFGGDQVFVKALSTEGRGYIVKLMFKDGRKRMYAVKEPTRADRCFILCKRISARL